MSELAVIEVIDRPRLNELAEQVRQGHGEVKGHLERALLAAISVGEALLEAKALLQRGAWTPWVEEECGLMIHTANYYMRFAHYKAILPSGMNVGEALEYIRGLPPMDGRDYVRSYPPEIRAEASRLRNEGLTFQAVSDRLHVPVGTVAKWCGPGKDRYKEKRRKHQMARLAKRAALREEAEKAARLKGGSLGKAYSLMRKLAQELDAASAQYQTGDPIRKELRAALSSVNAAEDHICAALGVDYGSWRGDKRTQAKVIA